MIWVYCIKLDKEVSWKQLKQIDPYPLNYKCLNPECKEKTMRPVRGHKIKKNIKKKQKLLNKLT